MRTVRIGGKHLPSNVRKWMGDSIGHWEGDTLVVETANFTAKQFFRGATENEWSAWLRRILLDNRHSSRREFHTLKRQVGREQSFSAQNPTHLRADRFGGHIPDPKDLAIALERAAALEHAIARLPTHYREVVCFRNQYGFSFDEVGRRLGLSEDAAQKLWARAVGRLRELLGEWV